MPRLWRKGWPVLVLAMILSISVWYKYLGSIPHAVTRRVAIKDEQAGSLETFVIEEAQAKDAATINKDTWCEPSVPCVYPDAADIRFIVLTFNRAESLRKCLARLNDVELDGRVGSLEIFIDRFNDGRFHEETLQVAETFEWSRGQKRVHLQHQHVGIYGQWIDSWRPTANLNELAIYVEDDVELSPFAYRWLREMHKSQGHKEKISGYSLQDSNVIVVKGKRVYEEVNKVSRERLQNYPAYFYRVAGTWAFAPHPVQWAKFQDWFHTEAKKIKHPYVPNAALYTSWYKTFERQNSERSMWTMWFIYFTHANDLSALVSNVPQFKGKKGVSISCNRREKGLHFSKKKTRSCENQLLLSWEENISPYDGQLPLIGYDGLFISMK